MKNHVPPKIGGGGGLIYQTLYIDMKSLKERLGFGNLDDAEFDQYIRYYCFIVLLVLSLCLFLSCTSTWFIQKDNTNSSATNSTSTSVDSTHVNLTPNLQLKN